MLPSLDSLARERSLLAEVLRSAGNDDLSKRGFGLHAEEAASTDEDGDLQVDVGAAPGFRQTEKRRRAGSALVQQPCSAVGRDEETASLQHLPKELLADIGERFLDAPVWHACKLGEASANLGKVFMDEKLWESFFHKRFRMASQSTKRRVQRQPSPSSRFSYGNMHILEARFREGQYAARRVLGSPHPGVAVLDIQVACTGDASPVAYAALRNGSIMGYDLDPETLAESDTGPQQAKPLFELTPPTATAGGPALCCLPVPEMLSVGEGLDRPALLVAGYASGGLCAWQMPRGCPIASLGWSSAHAGRVSALATLGSGRLVSAASDGTIKLWRFDGERFGASERSFVGHTAAIMSVAACPFHEHLLLSGGHDRTMRLWDARVGHGEVSRWQQNDWVMCVDFHPSLEDRILSADKAVHHWDMRIASATSTPNPTEGRHLSSCHRHRKLVSRFRIDPLRLASCSLDGSVKVSSLEAPSDQVASPSVSPQSSPALRPTKQTPEPTMAVLEATLRTSTDYVLSIDFDATRLLAGSVDGRVDVYDFADIGHFREGSPELRSRSSCGSSMDFTLEGLEDLEI